MEFKTLIPHKIYLTFEKKFVNSVWTILWSIIIDSEIMNNDQIKWNTVMKMQQQCLHMLYTLTLNNKNNFPHKKISDNADISQLLQQN